MFYVGLHQPADAKHFDRAFISVNRLRGRKKPIAAPAWIMDSGAFTEIAEHGRYRQGVEGYAEEINRWAYPGSGLVCAVAQDYMCEPFIVAKTGLSVAEHQRLTIERYDALLPLRPPPAPAPSRRRTMDEKLVERLVWRERVLGDGSRTEETIAALRRQIGDLEWAGEMAAAAALQPRLAALELMQRAGEQWDVPF
jgi:hypothetical protein